MNYKYHSSDFDDKRRDEIFTLMKSNTNLGLCFLAIGVLTFGIGFLVLINGGDIFIPFVVVIFCIISYWSLIGAGTMGSRDHWLVKSKIESINKKYQVLDQKQNDAAMGDLEKAQAKEREKNKKTREDRKTRLIKKYGKQDGTMISSGEISEKEYLRKKDLIKKYGDEFGSAVFSKKVLNDMTPEMVIDSLGEPKYKDSDKWYYGTKKSFKKFIEFKNDKVVGESECDGVWLDMPLEMLLASMGEPADEKKNVTKKNIKTKLYFGARRTRQQTTVYELEVRLEDNVVVGFRELE